MIRTEFEGAMLELLQTPPMEHADLSPHQMKKLLSNLLVDVPQDAPVLDAAQRQALIAASQSKFGKDTMGPILGRLMTKLRFVSHEFFSGQGLILYYVVFLLTLPSFKFWCNWDPMPRATLRL